MKRHFDQILGVRVRLRLLEETDLPMTLAWRNQNHIRKCFFDSDIISPDQHHAWYEEYRKKNNDFVFIIEDLQQLHPIGQVALYNIEWTERRAEFGRLMIGAQAATRKGFAHEATNLLMDEAFSRFKLVEVYLEVKQENIAAISLYQKCGFKAEDASLGVLMMKKRSEGF